MICVVIKGPTFEEAHEQISKALPYADLVELRLDFFMSLDLEALKDLRTNFSVPMIFTLRSQIQGGSYTQSEENRLEEIGNLLSLNPEYFDLENHVSFNFIESISLQFPETKLILSFHNFLNTNSNEELDEIYRKMKKMPSHFYKIAVAAHNCSDALRFMFWAKKFGGKLIAISMGLHGQISRILGPVLGSPITYASLEERQELAPGQLSAKNLIDRYHHRVLNPNTAIFGLIGDPVAQSISDETHNNFFTASGFDAVYVKMQVSPQELPEFINLAKRLPFQGISVTMPLKEQILPYIDHIDSQALDIGAVNTLCFNKGKISGFNTDGNGALNAIETECLVKDKRIVIIGAGGASKAIAYEALRRGGLVTIVNRDEQKAIRVSKQLNCVGKGLDYMKTCADDGYDILINCTPADQPIDSDYILPKAIVMDITTKPRDTAFLKLAYEKGCRIIYGYQMFTEQAIGQFDLWFKGVDKQKSKNILEGQFLLTISLTTTNQITHFAIRKTAHKAFILIESSSN